MPLFHVYAAVHGTRYLGQFEADTAAAAIEEASSSEATQIMLCHHCAHQVEDPACADLTAEPSQE